MSAQPAARLAESQQGRLASLLPDTTNIAWARDSGSFAQRMLAKMGWKEGRGLGKREDGVVEHVRVKRRLDAAGVGAEPGRAEGVNGGRNGNEVLLAAVGDYNALLAGMRAKAAATAAAAAGGGAGGGGAGGGGAGAEAGAGAEVEGEGEEVDEDEAARRARKAERRQLKRQRREARAAEAVAAAAEAGDGNEDAAAAVAAAEASERLAPAAAPAGVRSTAHVPAGRHKVLRQKDVRRYSAADMAAILGQAPVPRK